MGKRSDFERIPRDFYPTPLAAALPLFPHLQPHTRFVEPCAGDGALVDHMEHAGHICTGQWDIEPQAARIACADAITMPVDAYGDCDLIVTNPPWERKILHEMIGVFVAIRPVWLLFDADWVHTKQSAPYMPWLRKIVSVGRIKWIPDSTMTGKDNCAWHLFDRNTDSATEFLGRTVK